MQTIENSREIRGKIISENEGQVSRVTEFYYSVRSQSNTRQNYFIERKEFGWKCSCPDYVYRNAKCKHIFAVEFSLAIRKTVKDVRRIEPISSDVTTCLFCKSNEIVKQGLRHNKAGDIQKFGCKSCGRGFTVNIGFEKMKHNPQAVTTAMQLYFSGESLRNTQKSLRLLGVNVAHSTIYAWISKYTNLMNKYLDKITPQVSDTWRADEVYVKVKGNPKYLFAMMDDETRFWISQEVADTKERHDARSLFRMSKERAGKIPQVIVTDGLPSYHQAYLKEFYSHRTVHAKHIKEISFKGQIHNNKMERMNGEIRDREETMRGLKIKDTPILKGMQVFHNYIRPHMSLEGKTPGEMAGIKVEGSNKWLTLIQNASIKEPQGTS